MQRLHLGLVYHFNQNTVPDALLADEVCYRRLLQIFLKYPNCKLTIHFSGTLLTALQWANSETIDLLKEGIESGQFEILGSSFAQNILFATDRWDNVQQIKHHRQQIEEILGVQPRGFWNAERCWSQELIPLIADCGYEYTFLETNVFRRAGDTLSQAVIRSTEHKGRKLTLFPDDTNMLTIFGKAVRTGSTHELIEYLYNIYLQQLQFPKLDLSVIYAQDAEATGLWQFEKGDQSLTDVYAKFERILAELSALSWLSIGSLGEKAASAKAICVPALPDGQANWMVDALQSENLPWGEIGYKDWFDYIARSGKNIATKELYARISGELQAHSNKLASQKEETESVVASEKLYQLAVRTFLVHQYEFGCIGINVDTGAQWQLARTALPVLWASAMALEQNGIRVREEDVNGDGIDEITVVCGHNAYIFSPRGARLIYWFDLAQGIQLVGNQIASHYLELYRDDHTFVPDFRGGRTIQAHTKDQKKAEEFQRESSILRRRCLNDELRCDGTEFIGLQDLMFSVKVNHSDDDLSLKFSYSGSSFSLRKTVVCLPQGLQVEYSLDRHSPWSRLQFRIENEITPDYWAVLHHGRSSLLSTIGPGKVRVQNLASEGAFSICAEAEPGVSFAVKEKDAFLSSLYVHEITCKSEAARGGACEWTLRFLWD